MDFTSEIQIFEDYVSKVFQGLSADQKWTDQLYPAMSYSFLGGGKRFRPVLAMLMMKALKQDVHRILPVACAIEMIHTYSLIHDDLPCMDNDDVRRGRPTNHKVYGETMALLAGDALLTDAFFVLADQMKDFEKVAALIQLVAEAAGSQGMVGGQVMDIFLKELNQDLVEKIHRYKTGALIRVSCESAAVIAGLSVENQKKVRHFGESLGLAFQVKDDLLDFQEESGAVNLAHILGEEKAEAFLQQLSRKAQQDLAELGVESENTLFQLIQWNQKRTL